MAEAMEGIMGLPQTMDPMAGNPAADLAPVMQSYAKNNPREFNQNLMAGLSEADPQLAMSIRQELQALQLTARDIEDLRAMIQRIMDNPADYAAIRAEMIQSGMVESDDLPEQFDPLFFQTFMMVLEQIQPAPEQMAQGGLASLGRFGDTELAHVNPQEMAVLRAMGGSGSINPRTGLREFGFFSKIFKGVKKAVKSVLKSPIGQLVATVGLTMLMGPAGLNFAGGLGLSGSVALGVNTAAASTLLGVASGQSFGDALKGGVISGITAGIGGEIFGTPAGYEGTAPTGTVPQPTGGAPDMTALKPGVDATGMPIPDAAAGVPGQTIAQPNVAQPSFSPNLQATGMIQDPNIGFLTPGEAASMPIPAQPSGGVTFGTTPTDTGVTFGQAAQAPTVDVTTGPTVQAPATEVANAAGAQAPVTAPLTPPTPSFTDQLMSGDFSGAAKTAGEGIQSALESPFETASDVYDKYLSPSRGMPTETNIAARAKEIFAEYGGDLSMKAAREAAIKELTPGIISQYGPLAATGLGVAALGGAFEEPAPPEIPDWAKGPTGFELLAQDPEKYGLSWGGSRTAGYGGGYGLPRYAAEGGIMNAFPRRNGHITGPGTGTSDDVPAMLSDGEFVMTAQAVRNMGNGSRRAGAKKMHALMKALETRMA